MAGDQMHCEWIFTDLYRFSRLVVKRQRRYSGLMYGEFRKGLSVAGKRSTRSAPEVFMTRNFWLRTKWAQVLYRDYAEPQSIIDNHGHLLRFLKEL